MNIIEDIQQDFSAYLQKQFNLNNQQIAACQISLNTDEQKQQFGDLSSSCALVLAKELKQAPRDLAQKITQGFSHSAIKKLEIAGPGFLNFFLTDDAFKLISKALFTKPKLFFKPDKNYHTKAYNIEFVSANPTGPLHLGHGRGGIIGDVLARILAYLGNQVTKEFYINDAGEQIKKLGISFKIRCQQELGQSVELPEDSYHGEYLIDLAKQAIKECDSEILQKDEIFFQDYAKNKLLAALQDTLKNYGISFNVWFSEKQLHTSNAIAKALALLQEKGFLYEQEGATWFKSTLFGDDKDRVVRKASGQFTYIAPDIAYLLNKIDRGADHLIMVLGHDHHSYMTRLESIRQALGIEQPLDVILYQLVKMKAEGHQVRMSKRAGNIVTLEDVIDAVGTDVARFFYLHKKADAQLEFNLDLALKKTDENPVYYIQYAYVRINSILEKASQEASLDSIDLNDFDQIGTEEQFLLKKICSLKELLESIAKNYQTHLLANYTIELAQAFHKYYSQARVINPEQAAISRARIGMMQILKSTLEECFDLLGISKPKRM